MSSKRTTIAVLLASLAILFGRPSCPGATLREGSEPIVASADSLKAAFLLNFVRFIEWPLPGLPPENEPLIIGLVGEDHFGEIMDRTLQKKLVNKHPLFVKRLQAGDDLTPCHVVFICRSEAERVADIVRRIRPQGVLVVGENEHFLEDGGTINFSIESDRVVFAVHLPAAERAGLKISAKLLRLAKVFKGTSPRN